MRIKKFTSVFLVTVLALSNFAVTVAQGQQTGKGALGKTSADKNEESRASVTEKNAATILEIFGAIERRDERRFRELVDPDFEIHWPTSLPYGGTTRGTEPTFDHPTWSTTWALLQPTPVERKMDPRVVAANGNEVVVLWHQRGISRTGEKLDSEVLGLYRFERGKLTRAQMFYFDTGAVTGFLTRALDLEQERQLRTVMGSFRKLPDNRRGIVAAAYQELQSLSHARREEALSSEKLKTTLSDDERNLLKTLLESSQGAVAGSQKDRN